MERKGYRSGAIAHLGYFRTGFVEHRKWLDEKSYADLVVLLQFLSGPVMWPIPPWLIVVLCALGGAALSYI